MKMSKWKRVLSLVLAIVLVAPTVLSLVPELSVTVNAVDLVDVGGMSASYAGNGLLVNGVYEIWLPDTGLVWQGSSDGTKVFLGVGGEYSPWQSWVIEYGGSVEVRGSTSHWYTMYNMASGRTVNQSGDSLFWDSSTTVGGDYYKWRLLYDGDTGRYSIQCLGQHNNGSTADWNGYAAPVTAEYGSNIQGVWEPYGWDVRAVPVQKYADSYRLEQGTYRVTNGSSYWTAITTSANEPAGANGLGVSTTKRTDGTQLYQVDWTSAGYVTVFDANTGRYIGDRNTLTTAYDGSIAELYDSPSNTFDDRLRFYWRPVPVISNGSRTGEFYLCNLLTGRCLEISGSVVITNKVTKTPWTFTKLTATQIAEESTTQGYNGDAGVYLDSLDVTDTIKLPITIYDYVNDGMLFEYAETNGKETQTINGLNYIMGNNKAFTFQSGSTGGYWDPSGAGYIDNIGKIDNDDPSSTAWNAYSTCLAGRVWYKFNASNGWYSVDGQPVASSSGAMDWHWEVDGLGAFRKVGNAYKSDEASIYWMYAYNQDTYQGLSSKYPTLNAAGTQLQSFDAPLWSGDTVVNADGSLSHTGYSYKLYGQVKGMITLGLVQPQLNPITNAPEYRDVTVEYLAKLLQQTLAIPQSKDGQYAYNYVNGSDHERYGLRDGQAWRGLDDWLRSRMTGTANKGLDPVGTYAATYAQRDKLIGTWADCSPYINTFCDAAYYMLNNLFVPGSYNEEQTMFKYLELSGVKMDDADGNVVDAYVFDSGFTSKGTGANSKTAVYYDTVNKVIRNSNVTGKAHAFYDAKGSYAAAHPFLPVWQTFDMDTQTGTQADTESPYLQDDGVTNTSEDVPDTYEDRNYNFVMASNGEFKYSYADELFFNFEGDDDVYLFINGQLVLDIGGAHAISQFKIDLNDYVDEARKAVANGTATERDQALALRDGEIYSFDFYYMERHGWGSNMRIATNIRVVERGMAVEKDGAQLDADLTTNDIVLAGEPVEYQFSMTNSGTTHLVRPTFSDPSIGVTVGYEQGLVVDGSVAVFDRNGGTLDASDLILTYTNTITGSSYTRTFADNDELIAFLRDSLIIESDGQPDSPCGSVTIRGIYYKLTQEQIQGGVFRNEVYVTAYIRNDETSKAPVNVSMGDPVTGTTTVTVPVELDFSLTAPEGDPTIPGYELPSFSDPDKDVTIDPENGLVISDGSLAVDSDGGTLDVTDITISYQRPDGITVHRTFQTNEELKAYLNDLVVEPGGTLTVDGICVGRTQEEVELGFRDQVTTQITPLPPEGADEDTTYPPVTGTSTTTVPAVEQGQLVEDKLTVTIPSDAGEDYVYPQLSDPQKGVMIDHQGGLSVTGSVTDKDGGQLDVSDLTIKYVHPDGTTDSRTFATNEELTDYLHDELVLEPGGTLIVEGIWYPATSEDIANGLEHEITTQVTPRDPSSSSGTQNLPTDEDPMESRADFTIYVPTRPLYYHWRDHTLQIPGSMLLEDIREGAEDPDNPLSTLVETTITSFNSVTISDHLLPELQAGEFSVTTAGDITADFQTTGVKRIYLEIDYNYSVANGIQSTTAIVPVQIFVLDVQDETYVLDYGLHVELSYDELFGEDVLVVQDRDTTVEILGIAPEAVTPSYGSNSVNSFFALEGWQIPSGGTYDGELTVTQDATGAETVLKYVPKAFMEGRDKLHIALRVRETDYTGAAVLGENGNTDVRYEAVMFKTITILPANVVYYEDDFPAVTVYDGSFERTSAYGKAQSADQSIQYGYDPVYAGCEDVTLSGGILTSVAITPPAEGATDPTIHAAQFTFTGTGFEIVSRTDANFATAVQVDVHQNVDGQQILKKRIPVITEFDNHDTAAGGPEIIYQVPVIRVDMETYGTYTVDIYGIPTVTEVRMDDDGGMTPVYGDTSYIYIDGIRIYEPLEDATQEEYGEEYGASFDELRTLVFDGKAAVMGITTDDADNTVLVGTMGAHNSFTENRNQGWFQSSIGDLEQSIIAGPNNEVYLDSTSQSYAVMFYVAGEGKLDVGLHDMHEDLFSGMQGGSNKASTVSYWLSSGVWSQPIQVNRSGTEQYYPVDYTKCPTVVQDGTTYYQVLIRVDSGMVSFTNIKSVGLSFADLFGSENEIRYSYVDGILKQEELQDGVWVEVEMPKAASLLYKTEDGKLYYAQRYDAQGNEIPTDQLVWQTDAALLCWYYKTEGGQLYRAAQYDDYGNAIAKSELDWQPVGNTITSSAFHVREALTSTAVEQDGTQSPEAPQSPVETPQTSTGTPQEAAPTSWLGRFLMWIWEMLRRVLN